MEQRARVRRLTDDGKAQVMVIRESACSGDCHKCSGCGAAQETLLFEVENPIGAKPGDLVTVASESGPVLRSAAVLYMLPLVLFFLGYALGNWLWNLGGLMGGIGFAAGIALAVVYDRKVAQKENVIYTMIGFGEESLLESLKKGDNNLD